MAIIDRGEILLEAEPLRAVSELRGRIWRRVVARSELATIEQQYQVISTKLLAGRTVVHVFHPDTPDRVRTRGARSRRCVLQHHGRTYRPTREHGDGVSGTSALSMGVKKLPGIFAFEFRYQMRRVWPWLLFAVLTVFCFS